MFANLFVNQAVLVALGGLLVATAIHDVLHLTIPNRYCLAIVLLYPLHALTAVHGVDWIDGALVGGVALAIGFLLFTMRLAGGGDVKFFAAISLWAGGQMIADFVLITAVVGGVIALGMLIQRRRNVPAASRPALGWPRRAFAAVNAFVGSQMVERASVAGAVVAGAAPGPSAAGPADADAGDTSGTHFESRRPVGTLPYGAAIATGGLVVAAMLLMRG
jgi:prepilin peptidase CpaA